MSQAERDFQALRQQADAGNAAAQYEFGLRMLKGAGAPFDPARAVAAIAAAAAQGHAGAIHAEAVFSAAGFHRAVDWNEAVRLAARAAIAGDAIAQGSLSLLGGSDRFELEAWMAPAASAQVRIRPGIETFSSFIPRAWCDWIVARAGPLLEATRVYGAKGYENDPMRSNTGAGFAIGQSDLVLKLTEARIARAIDTPLAHHEPTNVLHYKPGQEFKRHHDFLDPGLPAGARDIQNNGQRIATFLIYLNDGFDGGETDFPAINWRFKGKAGDAILFWNVTADGAPDRATVHAGLPPSSGEKWLFSKWVRDRPYSMR